MTVGIVIPPDRPLQQDGTAPLILAIDDHQDNLLLLEYTLTSIGFRFLGEADAIAGLTLAHQYCPDLILLDIMLPGIDGLEFLKIIRKEPLLSRIPVIAVTGLASDEDRDRILQAGFSEYLRKPFMLEELEAVIRRHIQFPVRSDASES